jgi:hypothetical protein
VHKPHYDFNDAGIASCSKSIRAAGREKVATLALSQPPAELFNWDVWDADEIKPHHIAWRKI